MNPAKLARQLHEAATLHQRGDLANAEKLYRGVLKHAPQQPDALHLLGVLLNQRGERSNGISFVRRALSIQGAMPDAHSNLAGMLAADGSLDDAEAHYRKALLFKPGHPAAQNGLGTIYRARRNYAEACAAFEKAIRFEPRLLDAYINLCNTYRDTCREQEIPRVADQGLTVDPQNAQLHLLRSEAAFASGRLSEGWRDYDWRFRTHQNPVIAQRYPLPVWQGENLSSKSILLWGEQGAGDEIIFASMVKGIAAAAKRCVLQTMPRLVPLFRRSFPNVEIYGEPVPADVVRTLDVQSALVSTGRWRRTSFAGYPAEGSYLVANPEKTTHLRQRYTKGEKRLLVGLAWQSANVSDAAEKTVSLAHWGPVLTVPGITFVNLQYGDHGALLAAARKEFGADIIEDQEIDSLTDLDAFAAQTAAMDIVLSSSNTAAHMAGALGVPTFCMIPRALGGGRRWYWFGHGKYSPWYRAMTLFRQTQPSTWTDVIADMALALVDVAVTNGALTEHDAYLERLARGYASANMLAEAGKVYRHAQHHTPTTALLRDAAKHELKNGDPSTARVLVERALGREPEAADLHNLHGMILAKNGQFEDAVMAYNRAIARDDQAEFYNNRGTALRRMGRDTAAVESYLKAHTLNPGLRSIALNYALALGEAGRLEESIAALRGLVAREPDYIDAHYNLSIVLLSAGHLEEGWREFKWRLKRPDAHVRHEDFPQAVWAGQNLSDKHVLVWTDLGLGEEVLTASLIPDIAAKARRVTLLCSSRMVGLCTDSFPNVTVQARQTPLPAAAQSSDIDLQMSLAELGTAFRPSFQSFPARSSFLQADPSRMEKLREKYLAAGNGKRLIGISWRSVNPEIGMQKSVTLIDWLPILRTPGVMFVNLQYGDCADDIAALQRDHGITILTDPDVDHAGDMRDVAAQIAALDEVISISNTTAHLAGALGIPTRALLPRGHARLWYWFRGADRCLWYPNVRLMEVPPNGGWPALIEHCAQELQAQT